MTRPTKPGSTFSPASTPTEAMPSSTSLEVPRQDAAAGAVLPQRLAHQLSLQEAMQRHAGQAPLQTQSQSQDPPLFTDLPSELQRQVLRVLDRQASVPGSQMPTTRQLAQLRTVNQAFRTNVDDLLQQDQHAEAARVAISNRLTSLVADLETLLDATALENAVRHALNGQTHVSMDVLAMTEKLMERYEAIHREEDLLGSDVSEDGSEEYFNAAETLIVARCRIAMEVLAEKTDLRTVEVNLAECLDNYRKLVQKGMGPLELLSAIHDRNAGIEHFHLNASFNDLTGAEVASLANLTGLTGLDLRFNEITDASLRHLGKLTDLEFLGITISGEADIGPQGMTTFAQFPNLKSLQIHGTGFARNGMCNQLSKTLKNSALARLDISGTRCSHLSFDNLIEGLDMLPHLTELNISDNYLTPGMVETLGIKLPNLTVLNLRENNLKNGFTENGFANFKKLSNLNLQDTNFQEIEIEKLKTLPKLAELDLQDNALTVACIPMLKGLKHLKRLAFSSKNFMDADYEALREALPGVEMMITKYRESTSSWVI
ncbi:MAG: hypothetical protein V4695_04515 [Pseudomonadota bacterium]